MLRYLKATGDDQLRIVNHNLPLFTIRPQSRLQPRETHYTTGSKVICIVLRCPISYEEQRFMYKINQGHLTIFCIVFVCLGESTLTSQDYNPWFMYQNQLGPSGGIYYSNFVPCFVVLYLNWTYSRVHKRIEKLVCMQ